MIFIFILATILSRALRSLGNITIGDIATCVLAGAAIVAGILAYRSWRESSRQSKILSQEAERNTFSALLAEISSTEASFDRGLVRERITPDKTIDEIEGMINKGRTDNEERLSKGKGHSVKVGAAAERTIARYDRVGFFLLPKKDQQKPTIEPPLWLWTHVKMIWDRLGDWVKHRQKPSGSKFSHQFYGLYFERLANWEQKNRDKLERLREEFLCDS
jgi:hypothetical protein